MELTDLIRLSIGEGWHVVLQVSPWVAAAILLVILLAATVAVAQR